MTHHHLALDLLGGLERDAHDNHDGRTAEGQAGIALTGDSPEYCPGNHRDDAQEQRTDQGHLIQHALDIIPPVGYPGR